MIPMAEKDCIDNLERLNFAQDPVPRRELRSDYLAVRNLTSERRDELVSPDSEKFDAIIDVVDKLHEQVQLPREQVADAQALLDITKTLVASVMSHSKGETTPEKFITGLIRHFRQVNRPSENEENAHVSLEWKDIGLSVSPILEKALGCCTMLGPMNIEVKQRKAAVRRTKPPTTHLPKETVENLFALSFLAKDGRVKIAVEANGSHIVSPTNAPVANEVTYHHFVFRFDFKDWKIMMEMVAVGVIETTQSAHLPLRRNQQHTTPQQPWPRTQPGFENSPETMAWLYRKNLLQNNSLKVTMLLEPQPLAGVNASFHLVHV